jgi:hypothetical protein
MKQPIRLDFDVRWMLNADKLVNDPMGRGLKALGKQLPYRLYIGGEMISDRMFDIYDSYWIRETHFLELEHGEWSIAIEDITGWMNVEISNVQLNTVNIPHPVFTI